MRKDVKINGKSLDIIERELKEEFPKELFKEQQGTTYLQIEVYEERLNKVIGVLNYDLITEGGNIQQVAGRVPYKKENGEISVIEQPSALQPPPAHYVATATSTISIYDDDGNIFLRKGSLGAAPVNYVNETGAPVNLKSVIAMAESEAIKNCCKKLQMGIDQIRQYNDFQKNKKRGKNKPSSISQEEDVQLFHIELKAKLNGGKGLYNTDVLDLQTGEKLKFVIFKREFPEIEKYMPFSKFVSACKAGTKFKLYGYLNEFRGERQLIFRKLFKEGSA